MERNGLRATAVLLCDNHAKASGPETLSLVDADASGANLAKSCASDQLRMPPVAVCWEFCGRAAPLVRIERRQIVLYPCYCLH